jgi:adenine phosphoribosyltransferase
MFFFRSVAGEIDLIVGLDARGFLFGPIMAAELEIPFVPVKL